jgi:16S rRNA (cytosine1402-N4)-methyltransferase
MAYHEPVLVEEVLHWLRPRDGGLYLDATVGGGGHAEQILKCGANVRLVGLDCDADAIEAASKRLQQFGERARLVRANFVELLSLGVERLDGALCDLGVSSHQLDTSARGFSFAKDAPLDMRLDQRLARTAADIVAEASQSELERILREFGDETRARRIAAAIVEARAKAPIETTTQLAGLVERVLGRRWSDKIAPATRTFMALRMAVNNELENLRTGLAAASGLLKPGGRLAVISFHSGEDRVVKHFFQTESRDCICPAQVIVCRCGHTRSLRVLTKKPLLPSEAEVQRNPRARSAKLRVAERI